MHLPRSTTFQRPYDYNHSDRSRHHLIARFQLVFPVDEWAQSGKEGTESKLRSSDSGLDLAHKGTHNSARNNVRGEHFYVV
jgi:hypothetical protein